MIASLAFANNASPSITITPPAGWNLVKRIDQGSAPLYSLAIYWRAADASDASVSSYVFGLTNAATGWVGGIQSFSGVDTTTPIDVENGQVTASSTTHATPSVTTTGTNRLIVTTHMAYNGNITGWTPMSSELVPKRIQLLKEAVPGISGLALLVNASDPAVAAGNIAEAQDAAKKMSITVRGVEVRSPNDFMHAFNEIAEAHLDGVVAGTDPLIYNERKRIAELALARRLPTMLFIGGMVEAGGLMSYGPNYPTLFRRTAYYVDKILKGTKPADLPVEQPTKFDFVINLKTANMLGLDMPPTLLARADEVIE